VLTYFRTDYHFGRDPVEKYRLNELFTDRIGDHHLVTTRHRAWALLTDTEYEALTSGKLHLHPDLFLRLEDLGIILTDRNLYTTVSNYAMRYRFLHLPPRLFIIIPTGRCNLACTYCHAGAGSQEQSELDMSEETARRAVETFFSVPDYRGGQLRIEFQGGEPLLRYDTCRLIMDYALELGEKNDIKVSFSMVSNLWGMTDEIAQDMIDRNLWLSSSLDGPQGIHDLQRVGPNGGGTYEHVTGWMRRMQEKYDRKVPFLTTLTSNHLGRERELIDEYRKWDVELFLRPMHEVGRGVKAFDLSLGAEDFVEFWNNCLDYLIELNRRGEKQAERFTGQMLANMFRPDYHYMCMRRPCGCGISQVVVNYDGGIYGCDQARSIEMLNFGNVHEHTYDDYIASAGAQALRTMAPETLWPCRTCAYSPFCGYCVCRGLRQHGSPLQNPATDVECRRYRQMFPRLFARLLDPDAAAILVRWGDRRG